VGHVGFAVFLPVVGFCLGSDIGGYNILRLGSVALLSYLRSLGAACVSDPSMFTAMSRSQTIGALIAVLTASEL